MIEHRVVDVVPARPDRLIPPNGRRERHRRRRGDRGAGIADGERHFARGVAHRIQHGQVVRAQLQRAVDRTVRIRGGVVAVGRDLVVKVGLRIGPVPFRDDDVALQPLRPWGGGRQLARLDTVRPIREDRHRGRSSELRRAGEHVAAGLSRLDAPMPGLHGGAERAQGRGNLARRLGPQLVAGGAAAGLQLTHPLRLALHARCHAGAGGRARERALVRHAQQREPVAGRVVLRRRARVGGGHRPQVQDRARRGLDLGRIHEAVAPHPHVVAGLGKVGQHVAPAVVGDYDPDEPGGQVGRLRNHPDARLRPRSAGDHARDVVVVDRDRVGGEWTGAPGPHQREGHADGKAKAETQLRRDRRSRHHPVLRVADTLDDTRAVHEMMRP